MRGIASFSRVLLQLEAIDRKSHQNPKIKKQKLHTITATNDRNSDQKTQKIQKQILYMQINASITKKNCNTQQICQTLNLDRKYKLNSSYQHTEKKNIQLN